MYTIAIVDDDCYIGNMLEEVLTRAGYSVIRAYSGTEALMLFEQTQPDLVLLDLMLPGRSGEEVLAKIRNIPVIPGDHKVDHAGQNRHGHPGLYGKLLKSSYQQPSQKAPGR